jgi:anti-sigma-K factor RskA
MSLHEQYAEDLALHALHVLEGEARTSLEKHLESCSGCRQELEQLRGDMALVAVSTAGPKPPQRSRQRLLDAIAKEARGAAAVGARRRPGFNWWAAFGWVAAVAMLVVVIQLRRENWRLHESVAQLGSLIGKQTIELENARRVAEAITAPEAMRVELVASKTPPAPRGKAFYLRDRNSLVFVASNLAALPPDKIYELWLFPKSGGAPIPAGLFKPDANGSATVVNPPLPAGVEAKAFAVTLEPAEGPHEAPRGTAVMQGGA